MLMNLDERSEFWGNNDPNKLRSLDINSKDETITYFIENNLNYFRNKRVLEIGPGKGRQTQYTFPLSKNYALADISKDVLDREVFENIREKYILDDYEFNKKYVKKFDVVLFWYVVHHVLQEELDDFFKFVKNSLKKRGKIVFNYPSDDLPDRTYRNDGMKTTRFDEDEVIESVENNGFKIIKNERVGPHYCVVAYKK